MDTIIALIWLVVIFTIIFTVVFMPFFIVCLLCLCISNYYNKLKQYKQYLQHKQYLQQEDNYPSTLVAKEIFAREKGNYTDLQNVEWKDLSEMEKFRFLTTHSSKEEGILTFPKWHE